MSLLQLLESMQGTRLTRDENLYRVPMRYRPRGSCDVRVDDVSGVTDHDIAFAGQHLVSMGTGCYQGGRGYRDVEFSE